MVKYVNDVKYKSFQTINRLQLHNVGSDLFLCEKSPVECGAINQKIIYNVPICKKGNGRYQSSKAESDVSR